MKDNRGQVLIAFFALFFSLVQSSTAFADAQSENSAQTSQNPSWIQNVEDSFRLSGYLRQETSYRVDESREWTKIKQQVMLKEKVDLTDDLRFRSSQLLWYDAVYDATDNFPESLKEDQRFWYELRDAYVDYSYQSFDLRAGKQQIVWGDAVGLFFADAVNAKDLREYILPDFDLIRIPQWALDVEWSQSPFHAELVWQLPEFHRLGVTGSEFEFPRPVPSGSLSTLIDPSDPPKSISNSEAGIRLSTLVDGWDMSAFYLYSWEKFPVLFRSISMGTYRFRPQYRRAHLLGSSFSKALGDTVLKGELLINPHQYLVTFDATDEDGILKKGVVDYLVGIDYTLPGGIDANLQFMQRLIGNHADLMEEDRVRSHISVWLKKELFDRKITPELLLLAGLSEPDMLYRPQVTVTLTDNLQAKVGADIFQGRRGGLFGRFDNSSRFYTQFTYSF